MSQPTVIHVVPHTHWDREWHEPFQSFRMRLVELIDALLLQMEADGRFVFTLDGQVAVVDDYLEIRPEAEPRVRALIRAGRLAVGPWQILMDEFLVSGETIVRNLEVGWRRADELGGAMRIGYLPDMFGHIAQMPQILRRSGLKDAVVWRGVPAGIGRNAFRWQAPDGSAVRAEYLVEGYGNAARLFDAPDRLGDRLDAYCAAMRPFYGDRSLLAMYGNDHTVPRLDVTALADGINDAHRGYEVRFETLDRYLAAARDEDEAQQASGSPLPCWVGELRSGARANMLMGVASARIDLKAAAARAERWLERYAEPLGALYGGSWPSRLLDVAWRKVIENSAHDSISGCSIDPVVDQVLTRYAEAEQIGRGLAARAVAAVARRGPRGAWTVVNPSPRMRSGLAEVTVAVPDEWPDVALELPGGRTVAAQELARRPSLLHESFARGAAIADFLARRIHGRELLGRVLNGFHLAVVDGTPDLTLLVDEEADPPWLDVDELRDEIVRAVGGAPEALWRVRVVAPARRTLEAVLPVPPLGWTTVRAVRAAREGPPPAGVVVRGQTLDNGLVWVRVNGDGTLRIEGGGVTLDGVGRLVDGGDRGDSYNYGPPGHDTRVEHPVSVRVETRASGPARGGLNVLRDYDWPVGLATDGEARSETVARTKVAMTVELRAEEPFVRLAFAFENRSSDHRLRCHVPLAWPADRSMAAGGFAVVERGLTMEGGHGEVPLPTFPAHDFVDAGGAAILLEHVLEYELLDGAELALTLLRSTGLISRNDNPYREDPAGPERPIPNGQCRRPWQVAFALYPHAGDWLQARVIDQAESFRHPFLAAPCRDPVNGPARAAGLASGEGLWLEGEHVVLSALRRREDWLELRVVRLAPDGGPVRLGGGFETARAADLLGRPADSLPLMDGTLPLTLEPWEIRTVHVRRQAG